MTGKVSIYFPAEKETSNLRFHLHAPFASTVARDSVRECEANDALRDHLADLVSESMTAIRDQGLLTVGFLATLPNDKDNLSEFYRPVMNRLVKAFREEKLTPMKQGGHASADGIFRGLVRLSDLIADDDLATILGEGTPPMWIANPPQLNHREDNFLSMLNITEWTTNHLVNELSTHSESIVEWLARKPHEWHQGLYSLLYPLMDDFPTKWKLLTLRIVPCSDGIYRVGSECYFPSDDVEDDEDFPRVAKAVFSSGTSTTQQEKAREFLAKIGVREVGEAEQVEAILQQRYSQGSIKPRQHDMERFIELVDKEPGKASLFHKYFIFQLENGNWGKPGIVFLDAPYVDTGLRVYYEAFGEGSGRKWALSPNYHESGIELEKLRKFAKLVGVQTCLEVVETNTHENPDWRYLMGAPGRYRHESSRDTDYVIPKLEQLLQTPNEEISKLVWTTMCASQEKYLTATYRKSWSGGTRCRPSQLVHHLRNAEWIPQQRKGQQGYAFRKPVDAVAEMLPDGYPFYPGSKWLEKIEFGKTESDRKDLERRKQEKQTQDYQRKDTAAEELGFSSVEEAHEAKEMVALKHKDPAGFKRWQDSNREKASFPTRPVRNSERRKERLSQQYANAPEKRYETRERIVRTTRGEIDPETWLRNRYTKDGAQMICQICEKVMPFKKRNSEYYFEAVEVLSKDYFPKEHEAQFLALCPLCAAMYKEFIKREEIAMDSLHATLKDADDLKIPLELGELITSLWFVETHRQDIKTILNRIEDHLDSKFNSP
ncbi:hypothetical protein F4X33_16305 [Candidatus Poribacteria bacterium]|nr:hypothetical protein [Candidatus Poribacteria bacterium]